MRHVRVIVLNAFVEEQVRAFLARLPPWRDAAFGRDAVVEAREEVERVEEDVELLFRSHRHWVLCI